MTPEDLAKSLTEISRLVEERDALRERLKEVERERDRAVDRISLVQVQLEKAEEVRDLYMRTTAKWAERVAAIAKLSEEASALVNAFNAAAAQQQPKTETPLEKLQRLGTTGDIQ